MSLLTQAQCATVIRAASLMGAHHDVLSDFESAPLADVVDRFKRDRKIHATVEEWRVIDQAVAALEAVRASRTLV